MDHFGNQVACAVRPPASPVRLAQDRLEESHERVKLMAGELCERLKECLAESTPSTTKPSCDKATPGKSNLVCWFRTATEDVTAIEEILRQILDRLEV